MGQTFILPKDLNLIINCIDGLFNAISAEIILDSCNALSNRGETESLKRAVMTGHAELVTAVR